MVEGLLDALLDDVTLLGTAVGQPTTESNVSCETWNQLRRPHHVPEREDGDLQASRAEVTEHHVLGIKLRFNSHCYGMIDVIWVCCEGTRGVSIEKILVENAWFCSQLITFQKETRYPHTPQLSRPQAPLTPRPHIVISM